MSDLNDLTRSTLYEETPNHSLIRQTILTIGCGFLMFLCWTFLTNVNEVTRSQGEIIPSGYAQVVQHLEGGIVENILVEEGDFVEKGQALVQMGGSDAYRDYQALKKRQITLKLQADRLSALANGDKLEFVKTSNNKTIIDHQHHLLQVSAKAFLTERNTLKDQLAQKRQNLKRLQEEKRTAQQELSSGREVYQMNKNLGDVIAKQALINSKREVTRLNGDLNSINAQIAEARKAVAESESRLKSHDAKNHDTVLKELEAIQTQVAENTEALQKLADKVKRQTVTAPVRGLVKGLKVNTVGGVVAGGEPLMEIVPLDKTLIVETQIPPQEVGSLTVGQPARIKVSAFDFSRHGMIEGELNFLSATTFVNEQNQSFYKGRIRLNQNHVGDVKNLILPGMTVEADIITGQKTILAYLLKPVQTALNTALTER